jgi:hypothetical protein
MDEQSGPVLPKSPLGQAIAYAQAQWEHLQTYTRDGELSIDNNLSERTLRAQGLGRKSFSSSGVTGVAGRGRSGIASLAAASGSGAIRSPT